MIEDPERGFAWTNAILGLQAKEIHLCGEERALRLIAKLLEPCDDDVSDSLLISIDSYPRIQKT